MGRTSHRRVKGWHGDLPRTLTRRSQVEQGFARRVEVGQVGINIGTPAPIACFPVGGKKISMFGDIRGRVNEAIDFYTDKKVIISRWHSGFRGLEKTLDAGFAMKYKK